MQGWSLKCACLPKEWESKRCKRCSSVCVPSPGAAWPGLSGAGRGPRWDCPKARWQRLLHLGDEAGGTYSLGEKRSNWSGYRHDANTAPLLEKRCDSWRLVLAVMEQQEWVRLNSREGDEQKSTFEQCCISVQRDFIDLFGPFCRMILFGLRWLSFNRYSNEWDVY